MKGENGAVKNQPFNFSIENPLLSGILIQHIFIYVPAGGFLLFVLLDNSKKQKHISEWNFSAIKNRFKNVGKRLVFAKK